MRSGEIGGKLASAAEWTAKQGKQKREAALARWARDKRIQPGQKCGRWLVIKRAGSDPGHKDALWLCQCECGEERRVRARYLRDGRSQSCGCWRAEAARLFLTKHGESHGELLPEYRAWNAAIYRCHNPKSKNYPSYGGRGIKVAEEWRDRRTGFWKFFQHLGPRPSDSHSIDRINVDGHYEPGNVRWATPTEQAYNKRHIPIDRRFGPW